MDRQDSAHRSGQERSSSSWGDSQRRALGIALLVVATLLALSVFRKTDRGLDLPRMSYTEVLATLAQPGLDSLVIRPGADIQGFWAEGRGPEGASSFISDFPVLEVQSVVDRAQAAGVPVSLQAPPQPTDFGKGLVLLLQILLIGALLYYLFRQVRGAGSTEELGASSRPSTTFADVAGTQGASEEIREIVEFLRRPQDFAKVGAMIPKGALLVGPPGTGKTLLARAVAGEANVPFFSISGSEVTGFLVGMGAHRIKTLFKNARKQGGVIFIDEIDAVGGRRGRNQSHNEDDRTLNQLLVEMDGFSPSAGVVVLGATNRAEDLDPALKRPGRFDRIVHVGLPTSDERTDILALHVERRKIPLASDVDLSRLARLMPGASGADLANLLNEAALCAARDRAELVSWAHFEAARDRLLLGRERTGFRAQAQEWKTVAYHEAGHALVGILCCPEDGLHKVTIQPRGRAMGVAYFSPDDDRHLYSRRYLEGMIMKGLAGRAAEELMMGPEMVTSGAEHDFVQVNHVARRMIARLGMGSETGFLVHDEAEGTLGLEARSAIDREVQRLLAHLYERTMEVLRLHSDALLALAQALLDREVLDGSEVREILMAQGVDLASPASPSSPAVAL